MYVGIVWRYLKFHFGVVSMDLIEQQLLPALRIMSKPHGISVQREGRKGIGGIQLKLLGLIHLDGDVANHDNTMP